MLFLYPIRSYLGIYLVCRVGFFAFPERGNERVLLFDSNLFVSVYLSILLDSSPLLSG